MLRSLWIALAMYSRLPAPRVDWDQKSLSWAMCFFPVVGLFIALLLGAWLQLCLLLGLGTFLRAAGALVLPIAASGAIHLDGFCDTSDALGSHQSREKKLEILKDSHTGAFAIICCALYLLVFFALWCEVEAAGRAALVLTLGPVLSRSLSGLFAVTLPNARGTGMLATFTAPMDTVKARLVLVLWIIVCAAVLLGLSPVTGGAALLGAGLACLYYRVMSARQFGGVTGDLAGFFLQSCELAMVLAVVLVQKLEAVL